MELNFERPKLKHKLQLELSVTRRSASLGSWRFMEIEDCLGVILHHHLLSIWANSHSPQCLSSRAMTDLFPNIYGYNHLLVTSYHSSVQIFSVQYCQYFRANDCPDKSNFPPTPQLSLRLCYNLQICRVQKRRCSVVCSHGRLESPME